MGRAARLLGAILQSGEISAAELCEQLVITAPRLAAYASASEAMPLNRQLLLALFVRARLPRLAREANALRAQVAAAIAYEVQETEVHTGGYPKRF